MARHPLLTLALAATLLTAAAFADSHENKTVKLFDGKSLDGWVLANGDPVKKGWVIEDGALYRKSGGGDIYTADSYGDFDLRFEWKISKAGNSGVKYRVKRYGRRLLGPEYQVLDDAGHPDAKNGVGGNRKAASLYDLLPAAGDKPLNPPGQWNKGRIVAKGSRLQHYLNGKLVVDVDTTSEDWMQALKRSKFRNVKGFAQNARGRIMLQDHRDEVWYRDITLRVLD